jgi:Ca2+-binding RTX toxin-like protein
MHGGPGNDTLNGGQSGRNRIHGGLGNDLITLGAAGGLVWAGEGNDTINGGPFGSNRLHGGSGDDTVNGNNGRDFLWGGRGVDHEDGGDGNDVLHALARDGQVDTLDCGPGTRDVAWLREGESDVTLNCEIVRTASDGSDE